MNETIQEHYVGPAVWTKVHERTNRLPVGPKGGTGGRWVGQWAGEAGGLFTYTGS